MRRIPGAEAHTFATARQRMKARRKLPEMERRREATQATQDKFFGHPFDWAAGMHCVKLAHYHLRQMGKRPPALPKVRNALEAKKALQKRGWGSVKAMLDEVLGERIPPAMMRIGDLAATDGDEGLDCVMVCTGPRTLLGWLPDGSAVVNYDADLREITAAWRVS